MLPSAFVGIVYVIGIANVKGKLSCGCRFRDFVLTVFFLPLADNKREAEYVN